MSLTRVRDLGDETHQAWRASGRSDADFVAGCRARPYVPGSVINPLAFVPLVLLAFERGPRLLAWAVFGAFVASVHVSSIVRRHQRRSAAARMVIPFPGDWRGAAGAGLVVVGTTEVMVWRRAGARRAFRAPVAAVPRERIHDATFEDAHWLRGGGWIHVVGVDGKRATLGVRPREAAAGRRVAYALSRQADSPRW